MKKICAFIKKEKVLCIAFAAATFSCLFVPPDRQYLSYCDLRTLALLFCLMTVVAEIRKAGAFDALAHMLCARSANTRVLTFVLVFMSFLSAMFITNDVALLTFVPFAITVLALANRKKDCLRVVILQTVAANLGSMLTPVGNPQNIYIQSYYNLTTGEFLSVTAPVWGASAILIALLCLTVNSTPITLNIGEKPDVCGKLMAVGMALFAVCLLTVLRVLPWYFMLGIVCITLLIFDRSAFKKADYCLLLTFVCFFVFSGNLARIEKVNAFLSNALQGREYLVSLLTSQVISNVPATLLLSGFTQNAKALLLGTNVGGLGTPIASLASLIGMKLYAASENASTGKFLAEFTVINIILLAILSLLVTVLI